MDASVEVCAICLDAIKEAKAILDECHHIFCKACIDQWTDIRLKCPVCNQELKTLSSKKTCRAQKSEEVDEQFECLDHSYFKTEFTKLQNRLEDTKFLVKKNIKANLSSAWTAIELLGIEIKQKLKILTDVDKFRPKEYLEDIYRIEDNLKRLSSGDYSSQNDLDEYYDDENEEEFYEEYYDYGYDEYHEEDDNEDGKFYDNGDDTYSVFACIKKQPKSKSSKKNTLNTTVKVK